MHQHFRSVGFAALSALLLAACGQEAVIVERPPFFSLMQYVDEQVARLDSLAPTVRKTITFNGKAETHSLDSLNFEEELAVFRQADINRPAWLDRYQVDSLREDGRLQRITYTALEDDLKTQELKVYWSAESEVERIEVATQTSTVLSEGEQQLVYAPREGYTIASRQENQAAKTVQIRIEAEFRW